MKFPFTLKVLLQNYMDMFTVKNLNRPYVCCLECKYVLFSLLDEYCLLLFLVRLKLCFKSFDNLHFFIYFFYFPFAQMMSY